MDYIIKLLGHASKQIVVPEDVAKTIESSARDGAIPSCLERTKEDSEIYALHSSGYYTLHLGCPSWMNDFDDLDDEEEEDEESDEDDTMGDAFNYLYDLALGDEKTSEDVKELGKIRFIDSPHPGSDLRYVQADCIEVLAGLQFRLNQIGEKVKIQIEEN
jgi:hypothetical protein